ncbi:MAG: AAA family ATPase [Planctomycetota bacterium]
MTAMKLKRFRVTKFRSVQDSGWIDASEITSLVGTNESGKTNLLLPLWKLRPAKDGAINLLADAPRAEYGEIRHARTKPVFIRADFAVPESLSLELAAVTGLPADQLRVVQVTRALDSRYGIGFPDADTDRRPPAAEVIEAITATRDAVTPTEPSGKADGVLKVALLQKLERGLVLAGDGGERLGLETLTAIGKVIDAGAIAEAPARSMVAPRFGQLVDSLAAHVDRLKQPAPQQSAEIVDLVVSRLPAFVYYTTYGNLDSEIYLPHVIENLKRDDLTGRDEARARTLRVLFEFVRLDAEEILELGREAPAAEAGKEPSDTEIAADAEKKKEREVLLKSASASLTSRFRDWWRQGEYRFDFAADGSHFRIWVSDDKRPEPVELEGRSTGLQWFLSFYLIFLVESKEAHNGAVLLLDEPGLSLHPIAQMDLSAFFENLAKQNQLIYTTHSPFLVDTDHLDRVRAVYVDDNGNTVSSPELRRGSAGALSKSIYAAHAALGLRMTDLDFAGTESVIVEGRSDQIYCTTMRNQLISGGRLQARREFRFVPSKGVKGIRAVASILTGRDERLPLVLCDGDVAGKELAKHLRKDLYAEAPDRVIVLSELLGVDGLETEDLFPLEVMSSLVDKMLRGPDEDPFDTGPDGGPIVDQIEAYAVKHDIEIEQGWKVVLGERMKSRVLREDLAADLWVESLNRWMAIFARLNGDAETASIIEVKRKVPATKFERSTAD